MEPNVCLKGVTSETLNQLLSKPLLTTYTLYNRTVNAVPIMDPSKNDPGCKHILQNTQLASWTIFSC